MCIEVNRGIFSVVENSEAIFALLFARIYHPLTVVFYKVATTVKCKDYRSITRDMTLLTITTTQTGMLVSGLDAASRIEPIHKAPKYSNLSWLEDKMITLGDIYLGGSWENNQGTQSAH